MKNKKTIRNRMITFASLFVIWAALLIGAFISPQRETLSKEQLNTEQSFPNGTGKLNVINQTYSEKNKTLLLEFETTDNVNNLANGIDSKNLEWKIYAAKAEQNLTMQVVPIIKNKIFVAIKNVPKEFKNIAIEVDNHTINVNNIIIDSEIGDSSKNTTTAKENYVMFYLSHNAKNLQQKSIKDFSRTEFAIDELNKEKSANTNKAKQLKVDTKNLEKSIKDNEAVIANLRKEMAYMTVEKAKDQNSKIAEIENKNQANRERIDEAESLVKSIAKEQELIVQKISDIESGSYDFGTEIKSVKLKD